MSYFSLAFYGVHRSRIFYKHFYGELGYLSQLQNFAYRPHNADVEAFIHSHKLEKGYYLAKELMKNYALLSLATKERLCASVYDCYLLKEKRAKDTFICVHFLFLMFSDKVFVCRGKITAYLLQLRGRSVKCNRSLWARDAIKRCVSCGRHIQ